jgi:hypothetical protein
MNGYMNAEILGKNRGIKFGVLAIQKIAMSVGDQFSTQDITVLYEMLYWGLWNNCYVKKEVPDFTFEDVCDWVDSNINDVSFFERLGDCFKSANIIKYSVNNDEKKTQSTSKLKKVGTS